ncbi:hypothetical protein ACFLWS_06885 [Chloroflexota bacterium]
MKAVAGALFGLEEDGSLLRGIFAFAIDFNLPKHECLHYIYLTITAT